MKRIDILTRMCLRVPPAKQLRVVISSDVKNEADDPFAIAHQLLTPSFDVRGIIAAHYESKAPGSESTMEESYQELVKLLAAAEIEDVPALRGQTAPLPLGLLGKAAAAASTDEYASLIRSIPESEGVSFLIKEALRDDPRPLFVTVQGALTDVALALLKRPEIGQKMTVVWIGGFPYPHGGSEFNLMQDVEAGRVLMASSAAVWQIPVNVYGTMEVSLAELAHHVRPCGSLGRYLYQQLEDYNNSSTEPYELRKGENWCLGDSPVVSVLLQSGWRFNYHTETAPLLSDDMHYLPNPGGKEIRVYDSVDVRMTLEDMYAKLALAAE